MTTRERIHKAITKFNDMYNGQPNLQSESARDTLAEMVYDAVMKTGDFNQWSTTNEQQLEIFTYKDVSEHK